MAFWKVMSLGFFLPLCFADCSGDQFNIPTPSKQSDEEDPLVHRIHAFFEKDGALYAVGTGPYLLKTTEGTLWEKREWANDPRPFLSALVYGDLVYAVADKSIYRFSLDLSSFEEIYSLNNAQYTKIVSFQSKAYLLRTDGKIDTTADWSSYSTQVPATGPLFAAASDSNRLIVAGNGLWITTDGSSYTEQSLSNSTILLDCSAMENGWICVGTDGSIVLDKGSGITEMQVDEGVVLTSVRASSSLIVAGSAEGNLYISPDGFSWNTITVGSPVYSLFVYNRYWIIGTSFEEGQETMVYAVENGPSLMVAHGSVR